MRILIVEDDSDASKLLGEFLNELGECKYAFNGDEAIESFQQSVQKNCRFDLVCLDILLPGDLSGIEILEQIRMIEQDSGLPVGESSKIVMISAISDQRTHLKAFMKLCDGFIVKPYDKKTLYKKLKEIELL